MAGNYEIDNEKFGAFLVRLRKEKGMTQKELAEKLYVSDKAVSKWERSVSYPDITLLRELAAALEVSVTELLAGERDEAPPVPPEVQDVVVDTVAYAETARRKNGGWRWWLFVGLTVGCLIAALVVCIVNGFRFTWSSGVLKCLAFSWAVCYPLLRTERPVRNALIIASVGIYPFLWTLGLHKPGVLGFAIVSVACAWTVYGSWVLFQRNILQLTVLVVLLGIILHISIDTLYIGWRYTSLWGTFEATALTLAADALCLGAAWALERFSQRRSQ